MKHRINQQREARSVTAPRLRERKEVLRMEFCENCHRAGFHDFRCKLSPSKAPARRLPSVVA